MRTWSLHSPLLSWLWLSVIIKPAGSVPRLLHHHHFAASWTHNNWICWNEFWRGKIISDFALPCYFSQRSLKQLVSCVPSDSDIYYISQGWTSYCWDLPAGYNWQVLMQSVRERIVNGSTSIGVGMNKTRPHAAVRCPISWWGPSMGIGVGWGRERRLESP